ncbi:MULTISPECIES: nitroreductase family protein [Alphaproteobacteria]|uniref:Nitroreductase domain-containing protein n=2 Tax=Alphaproteobacteria TaxID=28211 RepID=A0A512HNM2_9HYPH|nr:MULTISPECIES: nitroreductase family protein [Alphaproteobacteria]GEO87057.1 hypothetical protein RNA01_39890 [Ciceribacter naphthalenivorans]GLR23157.1 hypothetical protein GCM10007920_29450 [Ciceribacter naphthalenivorans]GLT06013.1 hypothetical protein GCM10007926_29450 [Sphingomonas psychrolutea]
MTIGMVKPAAAVEAGRKVKAETRGSQGVRRFGAALRLASNLAYDGFRYWRNAYLLEASRSRQRAARMMADAHFLEYGMSLSNAKTGLGRARAERLASDMELHLRESGPDSASAIARKTLESYLMFNAVDNSGLKDLQAVLTRHPAAARHDVAAGVETVSAAEIHAKSAIDFLGFVRSRHSIRSFKPGPQPVEELKRAVIAAQETPSSCNRQSCHVFAYTDPALLERVRKMQAGNRTFGHQLAGILIVTSNLNAWETVGERYQGWVDGGLFAMTLAYALHAEGLGTCMLNWSVEKEQDRALRRLTGLDDSQLVITMMGFGWLPETLDVCVSQRLPLSETLTLNPPLTG